MEQKKDIGKIFRDQIDLLNKEPNNDGWNKIQLELDKRKKRRLIYIPFWFTTIGLLTAGVVSFWLVTNNTFINETLFKTTNNSSFLKSQDKQQISTKNLNAKGVYSKSNTNTIKNEKEALNSTHSISSNKVELNKKSLNQNSTTRVLTNSNLATNTTILNKSKNDVKKKTATINKRYYSKKKKTTKLGKQNTDKSEAIRANEDLGNSSQTASYLDNDNVVDSLKQNKNKTVKINTTKNNNKVTKEEIKKDTIQNPKINKTSLEVFVYGAPTISSLSKNKSLLDDRLNNNPNSSNVTFSYGSYLCLQGTTHFSLRIGIGMINLDLITKNVPVNTTNYSNINYSQGYSNDYIYNQSNNSEYMNITQEISFLEIPVEVKYLFVDRKFGLNAIAGVNFLILKNNKLTALTTDGSKFKIGETANLLDKTLGLNIGLGLEYKLNKRIKLNVEPMFKYHFQNSQNQNETKLLSLNLLTGLQIKLGK
jgi:hypothetical protein